MENLNLIKTKALKLFIFKSFNHLAVRAPYIGHCDIYREWTVKGLIVKN